MAGRVLVVGEALVDVVRRGDGEVAEHPGGSPLNVAVGLARLGHAVEFASRFGRDARGRAIAAHLRAEPGLTLTAGTDTAPRTSTATATLDADGAATYDFDLTWDLTDPLADPLEPGRTRPVGHLHTGSIAATLAPGAAAVLDAARRVHATGTVSYDPNARPTLMGDPAEARRHVEAVARVSDVVKASDEDLAWFHPDLDRDAAARRLAALGPALVVVTLGGSGSRTYVTADDTWIDVPATAPARVVDTVGAGDSFMAGLLSALLDAGLLGDRDAAARLRAADPATLRAALERATSCAAVTVSRPGADPPRRDELVN